MPFLSFEKGFYGANLVKGGVLDQFSLEKNQTST